MTTFLDHAAARLSEQVRLGEITQHEANATLDKIRRDAGEPALPTRGDDPKKAAPVPYSSLYNAAKGLEAEGVSAEEAQLAIRYLDSDSERFRALAEKGRAALQTDADAQAEAAYYETPAGKRELADQLRAQQQQRSEDIERGRALLAATGAPVENLTDDEVLRYSEIDPEAGLPTREQRREIKFGTTKTISSARADADADDPAANRAAAGGNDE